MHRRLFGLAALFCTLAAASPAHAAPLNLTLISTPDIFAEFIAVNYNSITDQLSASGVASDIKLAPSLVVDITNGSGGFGSFVLNATIDGNGNAIAGSLSIAGQIQTSPLVPSGVLLTGNLIGFGFRTQGGGPLEFRFSVTGGSAASSFGTTIGTILSQNGFTGSFNQNFHANSGLSDTAPIPEPGSALLLLLAGVPIVAQKLRRLGVHASSE